MRTIISTVGTSLLDNARYDLKLERGAKVSDEQIEKYLQRADPIAASAETNSLHRLGVVDSGTQERLIFLHSDTPDGEQCGRALRKYFTGRVSHSAGVSIRALSYHSADFKNRGLRALVSALLSQIRAESRAGHEVAINATGGFKAQIAYAVLIGQVWQVPVYYIHEQFRDIVEMPPVPVSWDATLFEESRAFFEWMLEEREPQKVENYLAGFESATRERLRLMVVEERGKVGLSPAGFVFFEAFEQREAEAVIAGDAIWMSPGARATLAATSGVSRDRLLCLLSRMRNPRSRESGNEDKYNSDLLFYPTGHTTARVAFGPHPEEADAIVVYEVFGDHNSYERAVDNGYLRQARYDLATFAVWVPE